jgi:hypothetical protein
MVRLVVWNTLLKNQILPCQLVLYYWSNHATLLFFCLKVDLDFKFQIRLLYFSPKEPTTFGSFTTAKKLKPTAVNLPINLGKSVKMCKTSILQLDTLCRWWRTRPWVCWGRWRWPRSWRWRRRLPALSRWSGIKCIKAVFLSSLTARKSH